jgi:alanine racemase
MSNIQIRTIAPLLQITCLEMLPIRTGPGSPFDIRWLFVYTLMIMARDVDPRGLRTWIEVSRRALEHNLAVFRRVVSPECLIMAVCKSNAYGHGLYDLAPVVEEIGADWIGVDSIVEAVTLREKGIRKPILVLGYTLPSRYGEAVEHRISLTFSSLESLRALRTFRDSSGIKIQLKIDTGMHRQGLLPSQWVPAVDLLRKSSGPAAVEGIYTHFAAAKDPDKRNYTRRQIVEFEEALSFFGAAGCHPVRHAGATAGALNFPEARYDLVRIGIGLMGLWPSGQTRKAWQNQIDLQPALAWRTLVSEIKSLSRGMGIGYDLTETLDRDSVVGICPIGYWHGFPRSLSRVGEVLVRGRRAKVLGTVSMDMIVVDLTEIRDARPGDRVTVIGRDAREEISAYDVSRKAGVSHYELLTRLNPLIQKFYID